jgi:hypothetical protein
MPIFRRAHLAPAFSGRRGLVSTAVVGAVTAATLTPAGPAEADTRAMPGSFTGYAFDTCDTPSQRAMNDWLKSSRYWAVGIYISGMNRACKTQSHLSPRWVSTQARKGWRLLPLTVGRQASCSPRGYYVGNRISAKPGHDYAKARSQGRSAAANAVGAARHLGIGRHSVLWYDLEHFDLSKKRCRRSALAFSSAWTNGLHRRGFRSGFYSSASSGITLLDNARRSGYPRKQLPGYLWVAEWNGAASLRSSYVGRGGWWPHKRVHQYRGGHTEHHGGSAINIDSNFLSTGGGTEAGHLPVCKGADVTKRHYPHLQRGAHGPAVKAVQCLLRQSGYFHHKLTGFFGHITARAVHRFRHHRHGLGTTSKVGRGTWTALLSSGPPLRAKYGSGGREVRRLESALNAASLVHLRVNGIFGPGDLRAVRNYQHKTGLAATGVVNKATWRTLRHGRLSSPPRHSGGHEWFDLFPETIPFNSGAEPRTDR